MIFLQLKCRRLLGCCCLLAATDGVSLLVVAVMLVVVVAAPRTRTNWHENGEEPEKRADNRQSDNPNGRKSKEEREKNFTGLGAS